MERDRADRGFGDLLREYRAAAGLSQESLADRARLSPGAVSALERGARRGPQRETLERLADALELDPGRRERLARAAAAGRQRPIRSGMRSEPPAPNNLPQLLTSFHGREGELAEFERIVGRRRLVTLLGAGGVGKTRLALEIAHRQLPTGRFADGVWVVDLAPLGATGLVASALARVLGIAERPGEALSQTIVGMLAAKTMLVLFDNCEHVLAECAVLIEALLARCPGLTILATTREALGVDGECVVRVGSLPYDDTLAGPAFDLLVDRLADADYQKFSTISDDDRQHIATICRRLDGVPLALELAAARAGDVGLAEIVSGLDRRFTLLNKGRRTAPPRHYSLRGMIDWSFALLDPAERALFAQLGLFAGSFSAEAAAAVGERDVRETLAALVAKSLLTAVPGDAGRYRLSETRRAYALDRLREGEAGDASARRFAAHFTAVAKAADARYGRMPNDDFLAMVEPDIDNFRAALEWTLGLGNDVRLGAELAGSMGFIYRQTALFVEGTGWAERALAAAPDAEPQVAARLHMALAFFSFNVGGMGRTLDEAVAAEALYRQAGSAAGLAWALATQAFALYRLERPEDLRVAAEAAVRVGREAGDPLRLGSALTAFALSLTEDRAVERFAALEEALQCCRDAGDTDAIVPTAHLAAAYYEAGDFARALAHVSDVAAKARKNRDRTTLASALVNVASYALALDDVAHAEAAAREALTLVRDFGKTLNAMCALQLLGSVAGSRGDHARAARLAGAADQLYREFDLRREAMEQTIHSRTVHDATAALGPERVRNLLAEGAALPLGSAIGEALAPIP